MWPKSSSFSNKSKSISDKELERIVKSKYDISLKKLDEYIGEWKTEDQLNKYREALGYAWEVSEDEKIEENIMITLEWRDASWKWSAIKRVSRCLNTNTFDIIIQPWIPTNKERLEENWYKRYKKDFPIDWKLKIYDRFWYNRSWVEAAMGFCTLEEFLYFYDTVVDYEIKEIYWKWIKHTKVYLSVKKEVQEERLAIRNKLYRKMWKTSPIDEKAIEKHHLYTISKFIQLSKTDHTDSPWVVIDSNEKHLSSIEVMKAIILANKRLWEIVQNKFDFDLTPDPKIRRTAKQELDIMIKSWEIQKAAKKVWLTVEQLLDFKNISKIFNFDTLEKRKEREKKKRLEENSSRIVKPTAKEIDTVKKSKNKK